MTSSEADIASVLRTFNRPVAEFTFTGASRRAAVSGIRIGDLVATAVFMDPMHIRCTVDPQVAFTLPITGSGRIIRGEAPLDWVGSKTIITNSYDQPSELSAGTSGAIITLRPAVEKLREALRSAITDRNGGDGGEADAILSRLLVRGVFIDTGREWRIDYFSAIMNLVAMFDDCNGDGAVLARIGIEDVLNRLLAMLLLDQASPADREAPPSLPRSTRAVDIVCDRIRNAIGSPLSIAEMEQLTGLTGRALNYAFRARYDCSPQEWQRNFLLDHARRLLKDAGYMGSVKSLSYELGFSSPSSFASFYRQRFAERPSETLASTTRAAARPGPAS